MRDGNVIFRATYGTSSMYNTCISSAAIEFGFQIIPNQLPKGFSVVGYKAISRYFLVQLLIFVV